MLPEARSIDTTHYLSLTLTPPALSANSPIHIPSRVCVGRRNRVNEFLFNELTSPKSSPRRFPFSLRR